MKSARVLVSVVLIPALLVASGGGASNSVRKLLRKPRYGPARVTFADRTQADGTVSRVTSQFLTLREGNTCRNVELAEIASVKWLPHPDDSLGLGYTALMVISSPIWMPWSLAYDLGHRNENSPLDGNWESTPMLPDGRVSRIEGNESRFVQLSGVAVGKGKYEVAGQALHLIYDASGLAETIPLQFECESLVLGTQQLSAPFPTNRAQAPIVGHWHTSRRDDTWEFTASGMFEKRITVSQIYGQITKIKGGVRVKWLGPDARPDEEWGIRTKGHHLFIAAGGATTEYIRAD
jgi:hypothetical protein